MKELLKALAAAKREIGPILKKETNPYFKSKYSDINELIKQVEPILDSHGLMLLQPIHNGEVYSKIYHIESETTAESSMKLPELTDPQKMGSAITYYRRYTLQSLLGLQAEDDDGNAASQASKSKAPYETARAKKAISKGVSLSEFKKAIDVSPEQEEAYKKLEIEYTKS